MPQAQIQLEAHKYTKKQTILGLLAVFVVYAAAFYFIHSLGIARPKMVADLNGMRLYSWLISIPGLAATFVTLIFSKFSDMYGRRRMLIISLCFFLLGTILSSISPTIEILILANTILMLGFGALAPLSLSTLGDMFAPAERSKWIGMLNVPAGIFALLGPSLAGWLVDNLTWRHVYWLGLPLIILCFVTVPVGVPPMDKRVAHKMDVRGTVLMMVASSAMIFALSFAGTTYPWASVQVIGLLIVSIIFWALFFRAEIHAEEPLLDPEVFSNRTLLLVVISGMLSNFALVTISAYYPLFLQGVQGVSALRSGQILTPFGVVMAFIGIPTGFLLARTKRYKKLFVLSYALLTVIMCGTIFFTAQTPIIWGFIFTTLAGIGLGAVPTIKTLVVQVVVPKRLLGVATGALFFTISISRTFSPAVIGSVMNVVYEDTLEASLPQEMNRIMDDVTMTSLGNPRVLLSKPAMSALQETLSKASGRGEEFFEQAVQAIRTSMEASLRMVFLIAAATMAVAFLLVLAIREVSIDVEVEDKKTREPVSRT